MNISKDKVFLLVIEIYVEKFNSLYLELHENDELLERMEAIYKLKNIINEIVKLKQTSIRFDYNIIEELKSKYRDIIKIITIIIESEIIDMDEDEDDDYIYDYDYDIDEAQKDQVITNSTIISTIEYLITNLDDTDNVNLVEITYDMIQYYIKSKSKLNLNKPDVNNKGLLTKILEILNNLIGRQNFNQALIHLFKKIINLFINKGYIFNAKDISLIKIILSNVSLTQEEKNEIIILILPYINDINVLNSIIFNYVKYLHNPTPYTIRILKLILTMGVNLNDSKVFQITNTHPRYAEIFMPFYD